MKKIEVVALDGTRYTISRSTDREIDILVSDPSGFVLTTSSDIFPPVVAPMRPQQSVWGDHPEFVSAIMIRDGSGTTQVILPRGQGVFICDDDCGIWE